MGEGRFKFNPKLLRDRKLDAMVSFGKESDNPRTQYYERIKRIMRKLQEISERVDKLAQDRP